MKKTKLLAAACALLLCGCSSDNVNTASTSEMPNLPEPQTTSETTAETVPTTVLSESETTSAAEISETTAETPASSEISETTSQTAEETSAETTSETVSETGLGFDTENALKMFLEENSLKPRFK